MIKKSFRLNGFTLVELLIVVAIMAVIVGVLLPQLSQFNSYQTLQNSANELQSALRKAQANALNGVTCPGLVKANNWQLVFTSPTSYPGAGSYKIQADCPATPMSTYTMPASVQIGSISVDTSTGCPLTVSPSVYFNNISGTVSFNNKDSLCMSIPKRLVIGLQLTATSAPKLWVVVETGGGIYVTSTTPS